VSIRACISISIRRISVPKFVSGHQYLWPPVA